MHVALPLALSVLAAAMTPARLEVRPLAWEAPAGSRFPRATSDGAGGAWICYLVVTPAGKARLELVHYRAGGVGQPLLVAEGEGWFVNWADFPTVAADPEGNLAVAWLERLGSGDFSYGVRVRCSTDRGEQWGEPFWLHRDLSSVEHGFPSLVALGEGRFAAVWLDARDLERTHSMSLRAVAFSTVGERTEESLVDPRVCECCCTDLVAAGGDLLAVWRDRSADEVRDLWISRFRDGRWQEPRAVHDDGWLIPG